MKLITKKNKGFTLIELMIVVAIIGILAAVAIPAFMRYMAQARGAELELNLKAMADGANSYFASERTRPGEINPDARQFPADVTGTPSTDCCDQGGKCALAASDWSTATWQALNFSVTKPFYGVYSFDSTNDLTDPSNSVATAQGVIDTDCDGESITGQVNLQVIDGAVASSALTRNGNE